MNMTVRDEEDAVAVIAVVAALLSASDHEPVATHPPTVWGDPADRLGLPPFPGPGSWWSSGLHR